VLPPVACIPGTEALEVAAVTDFASHYGHKAWNATVTVTVDDDFPPETCPGTGLERKYRMARSMGGHRP
jgi:hypothetical protein